MRHSKGMDTIRTLALVAFIYAPVADWPIPDVATQTFLLRIWVIVLCAAITLVAWQINRLLNVPEFNKLSYQLFAVFGGFTIGRIVAALLDSYLNLNIGWFSNVVNTGFYLFWLVALIKLKKQVQNSPVDTVTGARRISGTVKQMFVDLENIEKKINRTLES